jgi:hypothetical protein
MKIVLISVFLFSFYCNSQVKNTSDSVHLSSHSPKRAAFLSMIIPGAGQVYNQVYSPKGKYGAYWKIPLIYVSLIGSANFVVNAFSLEKELRNEYYNREPSINLISPKWSNYSQSDILILHESAYRKRTFSVLLLGGLYALQVIDASIEAHFLHFDISPSIAMQIQPTYMWNTAGLQLSFNFK